MIIKLTIIKINRAWTQFSASISGVMAKPTPTTAATTMQETLLFSTPNPLSDSKAPPHIALPCRLMASSGYRVNVSSAQDQQTYYALSKSSIWVHQAISGTTRNLK